MYKGYHTIVDGPYLCSLYMNPGHHMNFVGKICEVPGSLFGSPLLVSELYYDHRRALQRSGSTPRFDTYCSIREFYISMSYVSISSRVSGCDLSKSAIRASSTRSNHLRVSSLPAPCLPTTSASASATGCGGGSPAKISAAHRRLCTHGCKKNGFAP